MTFSNNPSDWFSTEMDYDKEHRFSHGEGCVRAGESPDRRGRLFVVRRGDGWAWHCHNCGKSGFKRARLQDKIRYALNNAGTTTQDTGHGTSASYETVSTKFINITQDLASIASSEGASSWLNKYNITQDEIKRICTRVERNRLGLIIYDKESVIQGVQLRNLKNDKYPKYITKYIGDYKLGSWFNYGNETLVIVEDIISGIKCARNPNYTVVAILGSPAKLSSEILNDIIKFKQIIIWLDNDKFKTGLHYAARLKLLYNKKAHVVFAEGDPKDYDDATREDILLRAIDTCSSSPI